MPGPQPVSYIHGVLRRVRQSDTGDEIEYYVGNITSDVAKDITFVPLYPDPANVPSGVLNVREEGGYQRAGEIKRMRSFATFLTKNSLSVVPPIILSPRGEWHFVPASGTENYGYLEIHGQAAILDGQHRVGGYVTKFASDQIPMDIDFIALEALPIEKESEEFTILNANQNRMSPSLLRALEADIDKNPDAWIAEQLNSRSDSPFHLQIGLQKTGPEHLFNLAMVTKNVGRMFVHGVFKDVPPEERVIFVIKYWEYISAIHQEEWLDIDVRPRKNMKHKLLEATGFIAWSLVASEILSRNFDVETHSPNWDAVENMITAACGLDWTKHGDYSGRTGEAGGNYIKGEIQRRYSGMQQDEENDSDDEIFGQ